MVRKSALVFGVVIAAWLAIDVAATDAQAFGLLGRRCCQTSGCQTSCCPAPLPPPPPVCSPCGYSCNTCRPRCGLLFGLRSRSSCNTCNTCNTCSTGYAAPINAPLGCSSCTTGINYAVPGSYAYAVQAAPNYGPTYFLSRAGVTSVRTTTVLRTSYSPLR